MFATGDTVTALMTVNVRKVAGFAGEKLGVLQPGDTARITGASQAANELIWWPIMQGWIAQALSDGTRLFEKSAALSDWSKSINFVLKHEGGYADDMHDAGGETNWGISKRSYPDLDIKNLTREQAVEIYRNDYWMASGSDKMDWPLCLIVFNASVNCGVGQARKWLAASDGNPYRYMALQLQFYTDISGWTNFSKGWSRRMADLLKECGK